MVNESNVLTKRFFRGGLVIIFFSALTTPLGYFVRMIFSRSLSITDYGLIYAVLSFFGIFTVLNDLGFGYAAAYFIPKYYQQKKLDLCWYLYKYDQIIEVGTSIVLSVIFILLSDFLSLYFFKHAGAKELIMIFSLYLISNGLISSIQNFFIGLQKDVYYSGIEFLRISFTLIFSFFFFMFDVSNVLYYASAFVFAYLLLSLLYLFLIHVKFKQFKTKLRWKPELFNRAMKYALPTFFTSSLYTFISHMDILFLTYFSNLESVGVYNVIFPIISVSILLLQPIQKMILPLVSELSDNNKHKLEILMNELLKIVPFIGIYFGLFIFMFSRGIISMMFGYKWVAEANVPLKIMAIAYSMSLFKVYLSVIAAGLGEVKKRLNVAVILLILSVISGVIGAKYFGIQGVIIANSLVFSASIILTFKIIAKRIFVQIPYTLYLKMIIFSIFVLLLRYRSSYDPISILEIFILGFLYTLIMVFIAIKAKVLDVKLLKILVIDMLLPKKFVKLLYKNSVESTEI